MNNICEVGFNLNCEWCGSVPAFCDFCEVVILKVVAWFAKTFASKHNPNYWDLSALRQGKGRQVCGYVCFFYCIAQKTL